MMTFQISRFPGDGGLHRLLSNPRKKLMSTSSTLERRAVSFLEPLATIFLGGSLTLGFKSGPPPEWERAASPLPG